MAASTYTGSCYCGAIGYRYSTAVPPAAWSVRACQCRFCRSHAALSASDPEGSLEFTAKDADRLQRFRFALGTADFLLCRECGVYIGAVIEIDGERFGIVNTRTLDPEPDGMAGPAPISYEGENTGGRVDRRRERWTPVSRVPW